MSFKIAYTLNSIKIYNRVDKQRSRGISPPPLPPPPPAPPVSQTQIYQSTRSTSLSNPELKSDILTFDGTKWTFGDDIAQNKLGYRPSDSTCVLECWKDSLGKITLCLNPSETKSIPKLFIPNFPNLKLLSPTPPPSPQPLSPTPPPLVPLTLQPRSSYSVHSISSSQTSDLSKPTSPIALDKLIQKVNFTNNTVISDNDNNKIIPAPLSKTFLINANSSVDGSAYKFYCCGNSSHVKGTTIKFELKLNEKTINILEVDTLITTHSPFHYTADFHIIDLYTGAIDCISLYQVNGETTSNTNISMENINLSEKQYLQLYMSYSKRDPVNKITVFDIYLSKEF